MTHDNSFQSTLMSCASVLLLAGCASGPRATPVGPAPRPLLVELEGQASAPLRITRLVHASVLLECGEAAILTDPWLTETDTYPPREAHGRALEQLPPLSAVVSTMNHYDHFDVDAMKGTRLVAAPLVVPRGTPQAQLGRDAGFGDVRPLGPNEATTSGPFTITGISARDGGDPSDFDFEQAWRIDACGYRVLVVGHRMDAHHAKTAGPVDIAILPVNRLVVKPLFKQLSLSPTEAAELALAAKARVAVPAHYMYRSTALWETFIVSHDGTAQVFAEEARARAVTPVVLAAGQTLVVGPAQTASAAKSTTEQP